MLGLVVATAVVVVLILRWMDPPASPPDPEPTATTEPADPEPSPVSATGEPPPDADPLPGELFTWMPGAAGDWSHISGPSGEYRVPEIVCGGAVLLDYDLDGDLDVFLVQGGPWKDLEPDAPFPGHALLRNDGDWNFVDVARAAGVFGTDGSFCMGAAAADYDNDGDPDLYVTAFDRNTLYRNEGDGRFVDVTEQSGTGGRGLSSSACFFDPDGDGWLDLYVVNYIQYTHAENRKQVCGLDTASVRDYCSPRVFRGLQDDFFHNRGDGTFVERAVEVGLKSPEPIDSHSKGLGAVAGDFDDDGDIDLYVSNDSTQNLLFLNDGTGTRFRESGLVRGCGYSGNGQAQAGMGTDSGDFDHDGDLDLFVVHLDSETNALYRNDGKAFFDDENVAAGLEPPSRGMVGFGTDFLDFDHDGDLDLIIANGHVLVHAEKSRQLVTYRQRDQLLRNRGDGAFELVPAEEAGRHFTTPTVGRGLATGDLDDDGDLDIVICNRDGPPTFLRNNHVEGTGRADSLLLRLRGTTSNRDAVGARVTVEAGGRSLVEEVKAGSSFGSRNDLRLHVGLGTAARADVVEVRWPDRTVDRYENLDAGQEHTLTQGDPEVASRPLSGR